MTDNTSLIARLESADDLGNELDVLIECALFKPDEGCLSVRPNHAGTKVIYTMADGSQRTHWAYDWSHRPAETAAILKALSTASEAR